MPDFTNIVVLQPTGISDTILSTPVAKAVKASCGAARVTWICDEKIKDLLIAVCPHIDDAVEVNSNTSLDEARKIIDSLKPDLLINLTANPITGTFWQNLTSIFGSKPQYQEASLVRCESAKTHVVDKYLDCIADFGITDSTDSPFPTIFPEALKESVVVPIFEKYGLKMEDPSVGIIPGVGANFTTRSWLSDGWCYLIRSIKDNVGAKCVLLGGEADVKLCAEIQEQMGDDSINLAGQLSLTEGAAMLKALSLVIGGDCGILHMAVAADTPAIGMYGPTKASERGPYKHTSLVLDQSSRCECLGQQRCQLLMEGAGNCMRSISLQEVMQKVYMVLDPSGIPPAPVRDSTNWFWAGRHQLPQITREKN